MLKLCHISSGRDEQTDTGGGSKEHVYFFFVVWLGAKSAAKVVLATRSSFWGTKVKIGSVGAPKAYKYTCGCVCVCVCVCDEASCEDLADKSLVSI